VASREDEDVAQKFVDSIENAVVEIYNLSERPHNRCSRFYQAPKFIPIVFRNLSSYDCHLS